MSKRVPKDVLIRHPGESRGPWFKSWFPAFAETTNMRCVGVMKIFFFAAVTLASLCALNAANATDTVQGQAVYELWCADCHAAGGGRFGMPNAGFNVLQKRYGGALPAELTQRTDLSAAYIKTLVRKGLNVMPRTRKTEISDAELDALAAYLTRNNR